jgi:hypothetical protein
MPTWVKKERRESSPQITQITQINTEKKGSRKSVKICGKRKKRASTTDYTD